MAVEGWTSWKPTSEPICPSFFYAMLAPLTLFAVLCFVNIPAAIVLLICVPLIPIAIAAVQTWAKKAAREILGAVHGAGRHLFRKFTGPYYPQNLSGG